MDLPELLKFEPFKVSRHPFVLHNFSGAYKFAGIYFIFKDERLLWIGQSLNIGTRLQNHFYSTFGGHASDKEIAGVSFNCLDMTNVLPSVLTPFRHELMVRVETFYINMYNPSLNREKLIQSVVKTLAARSVEIKPFEDIDWVL
jgi:hypothetical protein